MPFPRQACTFMLGFLLGASISLTFLFKWPGQHTSSHVRRELYYIPGHRINTNASISLVMKTSNSTHDAGKRQISVVSSSINRQDNWTESPHTHLPQDGVKCKEWKSFVQTKLSLLTSDSAMDPQEAITNNRWCENQPGSYTIPPTKRICRSLFNVRFLRNSEKRGVYLLYSHPGSGNCWVRLLMEELSGIFTGSVFDDELLFHSGMVGEGVKTQEVLAVKYHHIAGVSGFKTIIAIVRNPFRAILSDMAFKKTKAHVVGVSIDKIESEVFNKLLRAWVQTHLWLRRTDFTVRMVHYDKLVADFQTEIRQLAGFLDYPISEEDINCVASANKNMTVFKRQSLQMQSSSPYSPEQEALVYEAIDSLKDVWVKHGVDYLMWSWAS